MTPPMKCPIARCAHCWQSFLGYHAFRDYDKLLLSVPRNKRLSKKPRSHVRHFWRFERFLPRRLETSPSSTQSAMTGIQYEGITRAWKDERKKKKEKTRWYLTTIREPLPDLQRIWQTTWSNFAPNSGVCFCGDAENSLCIYFTDRVLSHQQ